ncbi:MAG: glycerol-3-phosphate responsive antiterminator [Candidatus Limnocylindrales bacterium]
MSYKPPSPATFVSRLAMFPCCPATTTGEQFQRALASHAQVVLILRANGLELAPFIGQAHECGKLVAVHLDLVSGLRGDRAAVEWLARSGADAVISSRGHLMAAIRQESMTAIQRLLLLSHTQLASGIAAITRSKPDIVEVLPGVILPEVRHLLPDLGVPLLAGGFVRTIEDVRALLDSGAIVVTSSREDLWSLPHV